MEVTFSLILNVMITMIIVYFLQKYICDAHVTYIETLCENGLHK